ncbi:DNA mismatch repair endonuclease MutH [Alishewanella sp. 16-MA]|uniref:DNA mismatch repair protein MutH n=1 Tax=Alishewanella maricola TaxID=2795740 RepID=A0ABS8C6U4_9ALTE|nr:MULTISPECIES: DNA mismatch repair endonuclease MutH [Gammaproteobacteria]MDP4946112.1 DNA mismatch repair endonuclease MutH [Alishewanella sp.]MCB5228007.1 DNA mismatch repair endonuclease MutH [Alishewanella maricola]MCC5450529.1 DNA mismatch repair endonuclease MutH [Rheinheimera sp. UJ51]MCF4009049.1 DNA mismatch repair endonuclease MutH [Rheinheimera sp. UJ63]MDP5035557.1 DNA mismatch repair endonuclease MutH [Alishewanella sp.]
MSAKPQSTAELLTNCQRIAGLTLGQLAAELSQPVPKDLRKDKGWVGQLMELALGASAGSQALPDFPELGIELKTLPIDHSGKPLESTYVCVAPLTGNIGQHWADSWVCQKLQRVLWLPILAERQLPLHQRIIGQGFLWQPNAEQAAILQQDWEELMELISLGGIANIRGAHGKALQLRPKAADSKALTKAIGAHGEPIQTLPRGFYLKSHFTQAILQQEFQLADR